MFKKARKGQDEYFFPATTDDPLTFCVNAA
jgi:hypothetical protein